MLRIAVLRRPASSSWRGHSMRAFATIKPIEPKPSQLPESSSTPPKTLPASIEPPKPSIDPVPASISSKPPRKPRRIRRFLLVLTLLTGVGYAAGVWYSLVSDNFHDFFTEYMPFGEDAVLYFEEQEFRKRFPNATKPMDRPISDHASKVTIPSKSGLSWKISEESASSDLETKGRHMSAVDSHDQTPPTSAPASPKVSPATAKAPSGSPKEASLKTAETPVQTSAPKAQEPNTQVPKGSASPALTPQTPESSTATQVDLVKNNASEASGSTPKSAKAPGSANSLTSINPLEIPNPEEPLVQDLVKTLNDIIAVVNADNSGGRFNTTIEKAKAELATVGRKIVGLKSSEHAAAEQRIRDLESKFDNGAKELVRRLEDEMHEQETRWRDEFEAEREKISHGYQSKLEAELDKAKELLEQRTQNKLLEQAVAMKQDFLASVKTQVETERNGRLAKLSELASSVNELEDLTATWDSFIEANLKTQRLQVAVEAVRASLESADRPRPFMSELATLKEIATDAVVDSAVASINPIAYQQGVPTSAQLIERFRRVAAEVRKASLLPHNAGVASHAASLVLSKVQFRGAADGDDVESVLVRTEHLLEQGSLDEAAREMNAITGWAKTLSADWLADVRRVLEVRQAFDVIATEARLQGLKME